MEHARRRRERNPNAETPERRNGPEAAPVVRSSAGVRKPELRLLVVGGRRIDVAAIGDFDAASHDDVSSRLDRLVAGGSGCLHVDCSRIVSIDRSVVDLFADVRERLQSRGGTLELVDAPPELLCAMSDAMSDAVSDAVSETVSETVSESVDESATPTADARRASSSAVAS